MASSSVSSEQQHQSHSHQQQQHGKRLNLLAGFSRPAVLGGKKHGQRQASSGSIPSVSAAASGGDPGLAAAGLQHAHGHGHAKQRAATSLGYVNPTSATGGNSRHRDGAVSASATPAPVYSPRLQIYNSPSIEQHASFPQSHSHSHSHSHTASPSVRQSSEAFARRSASGSNHQFPNLGNRSKTSFSEDGHTQVVLVPASATKESIDSDYYRQQYQAQSQHEQLVNTILGKFIGRLPHRTSENPLTSLHAQHGKDSIGTSKLLSSLQHLTRHKLAYIIQSLHSELELVIKLPGSYELSTSASVITATPASAAPSPAIAHRTISGTSTNVAGVSFLDGLRAQMLIAQIIAACLDWHARSSAVDPPPLDDKTARQLLGIVSFFLKQHALLSVSSRHEHSHHSPNIPNGRNSESSIYTGVPSTFTGKVAVSSQDGSNPTTAQTSVSAAVSPSHPPVSMATSPGAIFAKRFRRTSNPNPSPSTNATATEQISDTTNDVPSPAQHVLTTRREATLARRRHERYMFSDTMEKKEEEAIMQDVLASCSTIISYVSASRWDLMLAKLRARINSWSAAAISALSDHDEVYDTTIDARLFEYCNLNETRLSALLAEILLHFGGLKRSMQPVCAIALHSVLHKYMSENPKLLHAMYEDGKKTAFAGQPEAVFDAIYSSTGESSKRRAATWPTLAMLLPLCPEIVMQIAMGGGDSRSPGMSKKILFLDALRKAVRVPGNALVASSSMAQPVPPPSASVSSSSSTATMTMAQETRMALACYIEICRLASFSAPAANRTLPPLWILADEMRVELKARLVDPSKACILEDGTTDVQLMTDAIVALGRMSLSSIKAEVLPRLLGLQAITSFKIAALRALTLLHAETGLDYSQVRHLAILPVTRLLHQAVSSTFGITADGHICLSPPGARSKYVMDDILSERNQILVAILELLQTDPLMLVCYSQDAATMSALTSSPEQTEQELPNPATLAKFRPYNQAHVFALLSFIMFRDNHSKLRNMVIDLLLRTQRIVQAIDDVTIMKSFYSNAAVVCCAFARPCLERSGAPEAEDKRTAYQVLVQVYDRAVQARSRDALSGDVLLTIASLAETVALIGLCSTDPAIKRSSTDLIKLAAKLAEKASNVSEQDNMEAMAKCINEHDGPVIGGAIAQVKRLLKVVHCVKHKTPGLTLAWSEAYSRWRILGTSFGIIESSQQAEQSVDGIGVPFLRPELPTEELITEWISLSAFIVSTAYVVNQQQRFQSTLESLSSTDHLPQHITIALASEQIIAILVDKMLGLLTSEHARMRDAARDLLGNDLHPDMYHLLFRSMSKQIELVVEGGQLKTVADRTMLQYDQVLTIMAHALNRLPESVKLSLFTCRHIEGIILSAAWYANASGASHGLRLKLKVCKAANAILDKRVQSATSLSDDFRNILAAFLLSFAHEATTGTEPDKGRAEVELHSLQALASCLQGLIVHGQPHKVTIESFSSIDRLTHTYFVALLNLLLRESDGSYGVSQGHIRNVSRDSRMLAEAHKFPGKSALQGSITQAITNLVAAHLPFDPILLHELSQHDQSECAASLLGITAASFEKASRLPRQSSQVSDCALIEILCAPGLELALSVVEVCTGPEQDGVLDLIMHLLRERHLDVEFLKRMIDQEVATTEHESTLFRGNTAATRMLTSFARMHGYTYLRFLIDNLLSTLAQHPLDLTDMDMHRESEADEDGLARLEHLAEAFLRLICETSHLIPPAIRELCGHIQDAVRASFPDSVYTAIGGWIFLRYINPAIISPDIVDLEAPDESRKALLLISKLLQALSNNIRFKETGMKRMNAFVGKHILDMTSFLTQVSAVGDVKHPQQDAVNKVKRVSQVDRDTMFEFIWLNSEHIGTSMLGRSSASKPLGTEHKATNSSLVDSAKSEIWGRLIEVLWSIKQKTHSLPTLHDNSPPASMEAFLRIEPCKLMAKTCSSELLRSGFESRRGHTAFCLSIWRARTPSYDLFYATHEITNAVRMKSRSPVELILDYNGFTGEACELRDHVNLYHGLASCADEDTLAAIYIHAPSSAFVTLIRKIHALLPELSKLERKITILKDTFDLEDHFHSPSTVLAPQSLALAVEERHFTSQAILVTSEGNNCHCQIQAGLHNLLIATTKKRSLFGDLKCRTRDYYPYNIVRTVRPRHSLYGSSDVQISFNNGMEISLLEVGDPEGLSRVLQDASSNLQSQRELHMVARRTSDYGPVASALATACLCLASHDENMRRDALCVFKAFAALAPSKAVSQGPASTLLSNAIMPDTLVDFVAKSVCQQSDLALDFIIALLQKALTAAQDQVLRIFPIIKSTLTSLSSRIATSSVSHDRVSFILAALLKLSLKSKTLHVYMLETFWSSVLKSESLSARLLDELISNLQATCVSAEQKKSICAIMAVAPAPSTYRAQMVNRLRQLIVRASTTETVALDQAEVWADCVPLLLLDTALSIQHPSTTVLYAGELIWVFCVIACMGDEPTQSIIRQAVAELVRSLSVDGEINGNHLSSLDSAWTALKLVQQVDVLEQLQEGVVPQVVACVARFCRELVTAVTSRAANKNVSKVWSARCAYAALRCALSTGGAVQYRSLLLLSSFSLDDRALSALLRAVQGSLAENINSNTLQAYLMCFVTCLRSPIDTKTACQLFWLAVGTSQAHPLLFSASIELMHSAVKTIVKKGWKSDQNLSRLLLAPRQASAEAVRLAAELDVSLATTFTEDNFSFAVASLVVKGLYQADTKECTTSLLKMLALHTRASVDDVTEGNAPGFIGLAALGYCTALIPASALRVDTLDLEKLKRLIASSNEEGVDTPGFWRILDNAEITKNEPLVLAASLATSCLFVATSHAEQIHIFRFLHEIAELAPTVIILLGGDLLEVLNHTLAESAHDGLTDAAEMLLADILSPPPDARLDGLDITAYITALGLPRLLECASFPEYIANTAYDTDIARQKLRCCSDFLGLHLQSQEQDRA